MRYDFYFIGFCLFKMSDKLDISALAARRREEAIQHTNPTVPVENNSTQDQNLRASAQFESPQSVDCKKISSLNMGNDKFLRFDPEHASRIRLAVAVLPGLVKLMISSGQIGCDSVVNTVRFRISSV